MKGWSEEEFLKADLPTLGVGVVYVPGLEPLLASGDAALIDVIEVEPQTLGLVEDPASASFSLSESTRRRLSEFPQPKLLHSVGQGLGGTRRPPAGFVRSLATMIQSFRVPWVSEHLAFTEISSGGTPVHTGFMLPPLQTVDGAREAARTVRDLARRLPVPLAVETTVNYLAPRAGEISDGEFVAIATEEADCGILLDIHNVWTNERNGRQPVDGFLSAIPLERVWEIHVAGGFEFDGYWLDAHSGPVPGPVLELLEDVIPLLPNLKAVVYEVFPSFVPLYGIDAIRGQLEAIRTVYDRSRFRPSGAMARRSFPKPISTGIRPGDWETALGELVVFGRTSRSLGKELGRDPSIALVRRLIWKFRAGALVKSLGLLTGLIRLHSGEGFLEDLLDAHFAKVPPMPFASQEAMAFLETVREGQLRIPYIDDAIAYEECTLRAELEQQTHYALLEHDPRDLLRAVREGEVPAGLAPGHFELEILPD